MMKTFYYQSLQCINTLFLLFDVLGFLAELFSLYLFESGLFQVSSSLLDALFVLFNHSTYGALLLLVGFVLKDGFKFKEIFRGDFSKSLDVATLNVVITQTTVCGK